MDEADRRQISFLKLGDFGRLGNQLFQIAATIGTAIRCDLHPIFPTWEYCAWFDVETRPLAELKAWSWKVVQPLTFEYDESIVSRAMKGRVSLEGSFQSEKYFDDCREDVRRALLTAVVREVRDQVASRHGIETVNNACAVHVRRGDYLKFSHLYPQLTPEEYYLPAMDLMRGTHGVRKFVVVSDDVSWCRQHLNGSDVVFGHNTGGLHDRIMNSSRHRTIAGASSASWHRALQRYGTLRTLRDMMLMAACRHHILANSSFSWWSSWLSEFPDRAVIAPREWFKPEMGHDTSDIYRSEMVLMPMG